MLLIWFVQFDIPLIISRRAKITKFKRLLG
jgi:hypothetical protein